MPELQQGITPPQQETKAKSKYSPTQKFLTWLGIGATVATLTSCKKLDANKGTAENLSDKYSIANKENKDRNDELLTKQEEIIEQKKTLDSGNIELDKLGILAIENEVYRYCDKDKLKVAQAGTSLASDEIAILDADSASLVIDGKIKLGIYDTQTGQFRLIKDITNYADVEDSPKKVVSYLRRENNSQNPINEQARYKIAMINDGVGDCLIADGSIGDAYEKTYDYILNKKYENVCFNEINLISDIEGSGNLDFPIGKLKPREIKTTSFTTAGSFQRSLIESNQRDGADVYNTIIANHNKTRQ